MRKLLLSLVVLAWAAPSGAWAQDCQAPAGIGGVDQYCEVVPGSKGDNDAKPDNGGPTISDATAAALAAQGETGESLSRSLGKDPSAVEPVKKGDKLPKGGVTGASAPDVPGSNPLGAVSQAVSGSSTIGSAFFIVLLAVVLAMLGSAWVGWRRDPTS